jgi:hypothetical protein
MSDDESQGLIFYVDRFERKGKVLYVTLQAEAINEEVTDRIIKRLNGMKVGETPTFIEESLDVMRERMKTEKGLADAQLSHLQGKVAQLEQQLSFAQEDARQVRLQLGMYAKSK